MARLSVLMRSSIFAFDELRREVGVLKALPLLAEVGKRNAMGLPFKGCPPPDDERERATRDELAPAVNLFHTLLEIMSEPRAFSIARRIIMNASLLHLRSIYPSFDGHDFLALAEGDPSRAGQRLGADFAFADTEVVEMTRDRASFDVVTCRIPKALELVGASRLGSIFCEVDFIYFPIYEPDVQLIRKETLIHGGSRCDFRLTWKVEV